MTPDKQVEEIIKILSPDNLNQADAVFLVKKALQNQNAELRKKDKQIAKLEAELEDKRGQIHRLRNEKLTLLNGLPREKREDNGPEEVTEAEMVEGKHKPTGKTL